MSKTRLTLNKYTLISLAAVASMVLVVVVNAVILLPLMFKIFFAPEAQISNQVIDTKTVNEAIDILESASQ